MYRNWQDLTKALESARDQNIVDNDLMTAVHTLKLGPRQSVFIRSSALRNI